MMEQLFFELLQVSFGIKMCLSHSPSVKEWDKLYAIAKKQSLVGICFVGVQYLQNHEQCPPEILYLKWMGMAAKLQQRNEILNRQCVKLQENLEKDGFRSCILKGQGNSANYGSLAMLRQSGDIDIWMEGDFERVNDYVQSNAPSAKIDVQHIKYNVFPDTEVEAHYVPFVLPDPYKNRVLEKFFEEQAEKQFGNKIMLPNGGEICAASAEFNLVFQLVHIFHHLFTEGVGLRQLMDYYFVLRTADKEGKESNDNVKRLVCELELNRFASALMWVLGHVFGLPEEQMLWKPCDQDGRLLLEEIMKSGNFGKQDERQKGLYDSKWNSFWMVQMKAFRFWRFDHWAWFWSPMMRVKWFVWKKVNGYE